MSIQCPLCAEPPIKSLVSYVGHIVNAHPAAWATSGAVRSMIQYDTAARFGTVNAARTTYRHIADRWLGRGETWDLGVMAGAWAQSSPNPIPCVVVTATEPPPEHVQRSITSLLLRDGRAWQAPDDFLVAIMMRRVRYMAEQIGDGPIPLVASWQRTSQFKIVDSLGRDVGDAPRG